MTDATRPADGLAPTAGHTETHDAREGLRGLLGDRYGAFATALLHSAERLAEVTAERDALAASVARVRELHYAADNDMNRTPVCEVCHGRAGVHECGCWAEYDREPICGHCSDATRYPCPTLAALDGTGS